jgi:hypothetical protein
MGPFAATSNFIIKGKGAISLHVPWLPVYKTFSFTGMSHRTTTSLKFTTDGFMRNSLSTVNLLKQSLNQTDFWFITACNGRIF